MRDDEAERCPDYCLGCLTYTLLFAEPFAPHDFEPILLSSAVFKWNAENGCARERMRGNA